MTENKKQNIVDLIWDIFASVKTAVVIFLLISLSSIVGTIIEQQADPEKNIKVLSKMFGLSHETGHTVLGVLDKLGFTDMYHSWWFLAFLLLFAVNLVICTLHRLPGVWKLVQEKIKPIPVDYIEKMSVKASVTLKGKPAGLKEMVISGMSGIGFKPAESAVGETSQFYAEHGNYTRLGVYIVHLSILIILAGAIIGIFFGYNAFLNLPEGDISSVAYRGRGEEVPLGFELRCDNFEVDYYTNTEMPKSYRSQLTVLKNGQEVMSKSIVVNDPLKYQGVTFYQSSFGQVPDGTAKGVVILKVAAAGGQAQQLNLRLGETFTIPGTAVQGQVKDFSPALSFDASGKAFTFAEQMVNPAVFVEFSEKGAHKFSGWILKRFPNTWNLSDGNRVEFHDLWGVQFTGMQVRKDPGVGIVYLGCIIMGIGLYMTFFMSHRRIWVSLLEDKSGARIIVGASANRNRTTMERKVEKLINILQTAQKGGK